MRRSLLLGLLGGGALAASAWASDLAPDTWDVVHRESFLFERGQIPITLAWEDGLHARRFHLRLEAGHAFDAKLVRALDGTILYSGRRATSHRVLVPWGRGEIAHLTVDTRWPEGVQVSLELAVDPREEGLEVYSLQVNRFLRVYDEGDMARARESLALALAEDPSDSVAAALWTRLWKSEGLTEPPSAVDNDEEERRRWLAIAEGQRLDRVRADVERALATEGPDSGLARWEDTPAFQTRRARRGGQLLEARLAQLCGQSSRATLALYEALDVSEGFDERSEVFRLLVEANQRLGNESQARAILRRALAEAPDASAKRWVEQWLPRAP